MIEPRRLRQAVPLIALMSLSMVAGCASHLAEKEQAETVARFVAETSASSVLGAEATFLHFGHRTPNVRGMRRDHPDMPTARPTSIN